MDKSVHVKMPARAIYVMLDDSRHKWKHGVLKQTTNRLAELPASPAWNPHGYRRSITFRCTKVFSDVMLGRVTNPSPTLQRRIRAQKKLYATGKQHGSKKLSKPQLQATVAEEAQYIDQMLPRLRNSGRLALRFARSDVNYS